jgi:RNA polymerase sigma-70 factor, ECF subfamily
VPTELERLYREHRTGLVRLVERELHDHHEAEDVVQTAFLDAQRALERGTIPHNPPAWLAAIALNAGRRLRRRRLNAEPLEEFAVQAATRMPEIRAALASLPKEQRAAVVYRDLVGLSYDETAQRMGKSINAVTMLLHRGRTQLRAALGLAGGGFGLWRWLKRLGMPQAAVAKTSAAIVVGAGLATTGIVAAHAIAPIGDETQRAAPATTLPGSATAEEAGARPVVAPRLDAVRRQSGTTAGSVASVVAVETTQDSSEAATPTPAGSSTSATTPATATATATLPVQIPTLPTTVGATVTVSTPIAAVAVTTPTVTIPTVATVTATTPITTVTLPIP